VRDFNLGIIGGCLTHQPGIPKSELYHQRLAKHLEEGGQARLRVRIARGFDDIEHGLRLDGLLKEHALDAVLVHVRNYYLGKSALIVKSVTNAEFCYHLHPFLFRPWKTGWAKVAKRNFSGQRVLLRRRNSMTNAVDPASSGEGRNAEAVAEAAGRPDPGARRFCGVSLRDCFFAGGVAAGLDNWAVRDEVQMLRDAHRRCQELGLALIVLGPGRRLDNYWLDRTCQKLDRRLRHLLCAWSIPYCSLPEVRDTRGRDFYLTDGRHLTPAAHDYVASRLVDMLNVWLDEKKTPSSKDHC
jgi:hypothetical protein